MRVSWSSPIAQSDALARIRFRAVLVILAALLLAAAAWLVPGISGVDGTGFGVGQPLSGTQIEGRAGVKHPNHDGLAISPDGELLAAATPFTPINRLDLIQWRTGEGLPLQLSDASMALIQPAFSPDGRWLAFVVAKPSRVGEITAVSEIWISDTQGNISQKLQTANRLYSHPIFSPDGEKLAYFRDIENEAGPSLGDAERRASRGLVAMALFEYDLALQTEVQLTEQPFATPRALHYAKDGSGSLIMDVGPPLDAVIVDGHRRWTMTPEIVAHLGEGIATGANQSGVYRWTRGERLPLFPEPLYRTDEDLRYPQLVTTADGSDLVLSDVKDVNGEDHTVVLIYGGVRRPQLFDMGSRQLAQFAISNDRDVVAAFNNRRGQGGMEELQTLVVATSSGVKEIPYASVRFSEPIVLQ